MIKEVVIPTIEAQVQQLRKMRPMWTQHQTVESQPFEVLRKNILQDKNSSEQILKVNKGFATPEQLMNLTTLGIARIIRFYDLLREKDSSKADKELLASQLENMMQIIHMHQHIFSDTPRSDFRREIG